MSFRRRMMMAANNKPYDAEIEYLENNGSQYINTGIIPNDTKTTILSKLYIFDTRDNNYCLGLGTDPGSSGVALGVRKDGNVNKFCLMAAGISYNFITSFDNIQQPLDITFDINVNNYKIAGSLNKTITYTKTSCRNDSVKLFKVFSIYSTKVRFYNCIIKQDDITVLDLIPVRKGQVGYMYDKVSGQLFGNSGSGNFILGPDK